MKRLVLKIAGVLAAFTGIAQNYTTISHVDVFDGSQLHKDVYFTFKDSVIISISKQPIKYKGAREIEGTGKTILPPFINAHVHIANVNNLKEALNVGIFAMMDMFTLDRRANNLRKYNDSLYYAHYYSSNVGATIPGGHGTEYKVKIPVIEDSITPVKFVRERIAQNADYIKISQEHTMALMSKVQLAEIITETHKHKKLTVVHISHLADALQLVELGVDGLAHTWYLKAPLVSKEQLDVMKEKKIFIIPTLSVIQKLKDNSDSTELKNQLSLEEVFNEVKKAYKAGVPILAGTDAQNFGMNFTTQFYDEFILLSKCGLSNIDILKAGSSNIYNAFKLKEFNNLAPNSIANFTLIDGKPCLRIEDIYNQKKVWKFGIEITT
ncbi:MAG: amidohydrolase family protein [Bacteroidia bacterium]|nr:amidohydrolase family protein [Bacteroidia bacterium]